MLVYDWLWWGQLTNQNLAQRCTEVHGVARSGVWRCMEGCAEVCGGVQRGARKCTEVCGGVHGGVQRGVRRWLPLATIDLVGGGDN